jgi:hypothetical protein
MTLCAWATVPGWIPLSLTTALPSLCIHPSPRLATPWPSCPPTPDRPLPSSWAPLLQQSMPETSGSYLLTVHIVSLSHADLHRAKPLLSSFIPNSKVTTLIPALNNLHLGINAQQVGWVIQVAQYLPNKCEALSSTPSTTKKKVTMWNLPLSSRLIWRLGNLPLFIRSFQVSTRFSYTILCSITIKTITVVY